MTIYEELRDTLRAGEPVVLVTVTDGPNVGAKLLVRPGRAAVGTLGNADLDRVVARDTLGELQAGITSTRHYGERGEAREEAVTVFVESFALPPRMIIFGAVDFTAALTRSRRCSATASRCATRVPCSPRCSGSRWPTRSSTTGPIATSPRSVPSSDRGTPYAS